MQKPTDRVLFSATISYAYRATILGGESRAGADLDIRVIEVPVAAHRLPSKPPTYLTAIEVEQVERRDRFGAPAWERSNLPARLLLAVMREAAPLVDASRAVDPSTCPHFTFRADGIFSATGLANAEPTYTWEGGE